MSEQFHVQGCDTYSDALGYEQFRGGVLLHCYMASQPRRPQLIASTVAFLVFWRLLCVYSTFMHGCDCIVFVTHQRRL